MRLFLALSAACVVATAAGAPAQAPPATRTQALDIFRSIIAMQTSIGLHQVPVMAEYLAGKFRDGGFPSEDIHILPYEETASLVVRYRGNGKGGTQRRGNKGQNRFRGHSRWFTESRKKVISSETVKPAILTQDVSLVER